MSYSTRRSGGFAGQQQQQNVANIGQRRPVVTNNFVPGGQTKPGGQAPPQQQVRAQQPQQQPNTSIQFRNQPPVQQQAKPLAPQVKQQPQQPPQVKTQPQQVKQQPPQVKQAVPQMSAQQLQQQQAAQQQQQAAQQLQQQQAAQQLQQQQAAQQLQQQQAAQQLQQQQAAQQQQQQQIKMETAPAQSNQFAPATGNTAIENANGEDMDTSVEEPKKPFWPRNRVKIAKKEKNRRRNVMLSHTLKPKNAVMILNELVKGTSYVVEELPVRFDGNSFKATVSYDEQDHVGFGRTKMHAKNSAAEKALKHFVKTHKLQEVKKDEEGNEKMDLTEEDTQNPLPWQHVISFALFKLFCSWDEDPNARPLSSHKPEPSEQKASKKMPANPELINPLMLVNQMLPQAHFEEIEKTGVPPNIVFSFRCIVGEDSFIGSGPNKKAAKRMAAYGACHRILGVNYPPDVYTPNF